MNHRPADDHPPRSDNPYAAPAARIEDAPADATQAETIRREHLRHEGRLQAVAWLYWLAAAVLAFAAFAVGRAGLHAVEGLGFIAGVVAFYVALAAGFLVIGIGYRRLRPWVRVPGAIVSALGLLAVPIGTLVNAYILFLMFGAKGQRVFSPEYAQIRAQTPHLRFRRSTAEKVAMLLVVVIAVVLLFWLAQRG